MSRPVLVSLEDYQSLEEHLLPPALLPPTAPISKNPCGRSAKASSFHSPLKIYDHPVLESAWSDFEWFLDNDKQIAKRIRILLKDILRSPEEGIGKPEKLKFDLAGCWSRRINDEHRLVYQIEKDAIFVVSCRYHY